MNERRKHKRHDTTFEVQLENVDLGKTKAFSHNISAGGLFVRTKTPLPKGSKITVLLSVPDSEEKIQVKGIVKWETKKLWSKAEGGGEGTGMGIQFIDPDEKAMKAIRDLIYKLEETEPM